MLGRYTIICLARKIHYYLFGKLNHFLLKCILLTAKTTSWWALEAAVAEDYGCYIHELIEIFCCCEVVELHNKLNLWCGLLNSYNASIGGTYYLLPPFALAGSMKILPLI
jgi:hypothetical protein